MSLPLAVEISIFSGRLFFAVSRTVTHVYSQSLLHAHHVVGFEQNGAGHLFPVIVFMASSRSLNVSHLGPFFHLNLVDLDSNIIDVYVDCTFDALHTSRSMTTLTLCR